MLRYRVTAIVTTDIETDSDSREEAIKFLDKILPANLPFAIHTIKKERKKQNKILGEFTPEEIFPYVTEEESFKEFIVQDTSYCIRMNSLRYLTFKKNPICVYCGLIGTKFLLETAHGSHQPHFNFYGIRDGKLIMMTRDHIIPKSKGGQEILGNMQTTCILDNNIKDADIFTLEEIKQLRTIRMMIRRGTTEREQAKLFKEVRDKILNRKDSNA
jgi:hypothetical protein